MTFVVRVNGEDVWETGLQVIEVSLQSATGEKAKVGVANDMGVIDLIVMEVAAGGPVRLDHLEALQLKAKREMSEGEVASGALSDRYEAPDAMHATQGEHSYTATPGGGENDPSLPPVANTPADTTSDDPTATTVASDAATGSGDTGSSFPPFATSTSENTADTGE